MDDLVRSPILHHLRVGGVVGEGCLLLGEIGPLLLFRGDFVSLVGQLVLRGVLHVVRVDDLVLLLDIEGLELRRSSHFLHRVVPSVLSLIVCMHTLRVVVADDLINHLPPARSSHEMLIILHDIAHLSSNVLSEGVPGRSLRVVIIVFMLDELRLVFRGVADTVRVLGHDQLLL